MTHGCRRSTGLLILTAFLGVCAAGAAPAEEAPEDAISAPPKTWHEGRNWTHDPVWKDEEIYLEADLDQDGEEEVVIGYVGFYKPPRKESEGPRMFELPKKEIPIIEHRVFYKIFDKDAGGHWECVRTLTGLERPGKVHIVKLPESDTPGLLIISGGGEKYKDISLYRWQEGGYRLLDNHGTSQTLSVHAEPALRIQEGDAVFVWDPEKKRLTKDQKNPD